MEELQRVAGKTFAKTEVRNRRAMAAAVGAILLAGGAGTAFWNGPAVWAALVCLTGTVILLWSIFYYPFTGWASCRSLGKAREPSDFFLEKREILLTQSNGQARFPYTECDRLIEMERHLFLIMNNGQGLILNKANLMGGSVEELRAFLKEKTGKPLEWLGRGRPPEGTDGTTD